MMTIEERIDDLEKIINKLHSQVFGKEGKIEHAEKFQDLGFDIDALCMAEYDVSELRKLLNKK